MNERRPKVQAKKARAELEPTKKMTMRGDAIGAMANAIDEIDEYLEHGGLAHLEEAHRLLTENIEGTVASNLHAHSHFENAIEELEEVINNEN